MDFRGYRGVRGSRRVVGRWKVTDVRVFRTECDWVPLSAAFLAALALTSWGLAAADDQLYVLGDGGAGRGGGLDTGLGILLF